MSIIPLTDQELRYQISQIRDLPVLPLSLQRLMEIIRDEIDSPNELENIIGYEQTLAARVLRVANSAYYGSRGGVRTLSRALLVIGCEQVKSLCLSTLLIQLLNGSSFYPGQREMLWKHAFATSRIAANMAVKRPWISREEASILGLVHDLGRVVMAVHFKEQFRSIMEMSAKRKNPPWCIELQLGFTHTQLGKYVAARWGFPEVFQRVMEFHHCPDRSPSHRAEAKLIHLANVLANADAFPELLSDRMTLTYCGELYTPADEWQEHQETLPKVWEEVNHLWELLK